MTDELQSLMTQAYDRWQASEWSKEEFWDQLDADERFAVMVGNLNYQVENGGFFQWWDNGYATPENVNYLIRACDRVGTASAMDVKALLQHFRYMIQHCDVNDEDNSPFEILGDMLDTRYYKVNNQFLKDCEEYISNLTT